MVSEYTPTTEEVRNGWVCCVFDSGGVWVSKAAYEDAQWNERRTEAQFDRWLSQLLAEAWERGRDDEYAYSVEHAQMPTNPYREEN